jgi:hypothetical protein
MVAKPPILGLLLAVAMARQAAPAPAAMTSNTTNSGTNASQGAAVLNQLAPETDLHSFLPSFIGFTKHQALEFARELKLKVQFVEGSSGPSKAVVNQYPKPGAGWPPNREVTLELG